jgi:hypothetical protein
LQVACKTRRASQCPPCAADYRADTYQVICTGLSGGKGIPATVAGHPCVFTTLTAPSFGPVHQHRKKDGQLLRCRPRRRSETCPHGVRLSCPDRHPRDDPLLGEPLCPDCYDYTGAVLFNAYAPELWRRFTIALRHSLARQAGLPNSGLPPSSASLTPRLPNTNGVASSTSTPSSASTGPQGRQLPPPAWATRALLTAAIDQAARAVHLETPATGNLSPRTLAWGREADTRLILITGELTDRRVAAYVAKYATKAAECTGTLDRRITPSDRLADLPVRDHARRLIAECFRLARFPEFESLRLGVWAHMLGFGGHFSTKSRTYSITFGSLRAERANHQREKAIAAGLRPNLDRDNTLVLTEWHFVGRGNQLAAVDPLPGDQDSGPHGEQASDVG